MAYELNFRYSYFPTDWNDDVRMNFLFSTFRERSVNPEGYDAKLNFWSSTIQDLCLQSECPVISLATVCSALDRKHRHPMCLDVVLDNMISQGLIMIMSEYCNVEQEKGWLGWGYDVLVQKPVSWGFSTFQSMLNWTKKDDRFVVLSVVKVLAARILKHYYELVETKWTDNAVFLEHFRQECRNICSESNFHLAVIYLQRQKKAHVFEEFGEKVIKFRKMGEKKTPLTELDKGILSLNKARDTLLEDIDLLEEKIISCNNNAREMVKTGLKTKAMLSLKKKKRFEIVLKKKSVSLDNIENLLCQLKNSGSEKMVLEAYRSGVQAMKQSTSGELDLDNIDDVMSDVKGALDDYTEVQATLAKSVSSNDDSLDEFEAELEDILGDEKHIITGKERGQSPPKATDDDLLRRLAALRAPPEEAPPVKKPTLSKPLRAP